MEGLFDLYRERFGAEPWKVSPLTGSASNRRYYRIEPLDGTPQESVIGVVGTDVQENEAFITLAGHFRSKGIAVPEVLGVSEDGLRYLQEDLGADVLSDIAAEDNADLFCRTMAELPKIQFDGAQGLDFNICYPQPSFDRRMVMFDLNYFKYCFLKPSGLEFNEVRLQDDFEKLADALLAEDSDTFLYRDFNARNVMIKEGKSYFIDFQGGRRGPIYYDVASFIWQARAKYPQWLKEKMLESYIEALKEYRSVDMIDFNRKLTLFILFRTLQVLGAYGFRGLIEHKAKFVTPIPQALANLKELLPGIEDEYTYLHDVLMSMTGLPRFSAAPEDGRLEVKVYSFSYKKGIPEDLSGNGGGYVFDCRSIHNPGRYEPYKKLTGRDREVIDFLEDDGEITGYLEHVYGVVGPHVETYAKRGFTSLAVSFGCTGGQHRSVYCAEHLAHYLADRYPAVRVRLIHREQGIEELL